MKGIRGVVWLACGLAALNVAIRSFGETLVPEERHPLQSVWPVVRVRVPQGSDVKCSLPVLSNSRGARTTW